MRILIALALLLSACAAAPRAPLDTRSIGWEAIQRESEPIIIDQASGPAVFAAAHALSDVARRLNIEDFAGCPTVAHGLEATVYPAPRTGGNLYVVVINQRFTRCGDVGDERFLDWDVAYVVSADGRTIRKAP